MYSYKLHAFQEAGRAVCLYLPGCLVLSDEKSCRVVRGGQELEVSVFCLLVGDLLRLEAGDEVPADAVMVQGAELKTDESGMTGESDAISKKPEVDCWQQVREINKQKEQQQQQEQHEKQQQQQHQQVGFGEAPQHHLVASPILVAGSTTLAGSCSALVIAVGPRSQQGQLFQSLTAVDAQPTPLQSKP